MEFSKFNSIIFFTIIFVSNYYFLALAENPLNTKLLRKGWGAGGSSVKKGAETPVYLALSDEVKGESGGYFINKQRKKPSAAASKLELQNKLWNKSIEMIRYQGILNKIPECFLEA